MRSAPARAGAVVGAVAILGAAFAACSAGERPARNPLPPATAQVTRTTLVDTRSLTGTLSFGEATPVAASGGTVTWIAPVGSTVGRGEALFRIDERPAVVLFGPVPMYRAIGEGARGTDVLQLQQNLAEIGYKGLTPDGLYGPATASAVRSWQADLGLRQTGTIQPGEIVFTPGPIRVAEHAARVGDSARGAALLSYTGTARVVTVPVRVVDQGLAVEGRAVTVTMPGGAAVAGTISHVGTVVRNGNIDVIVTVGDQQALGRLAVAPVEVAFVSERRQGVLVVPVAALLALAEGGYGLEIVEEDRTRIVRVRTGLFAGGRVEITGDGVAEGMTVGMPK